MKMLVLEVAALMLAASAAAAVTASALPQSAASARSAHESGTAGASMVVAQQSTNMSRADHRGDVSSGRRSEDDCFNVRLVQGYSSVGGDTIRLNVDNRRAFEVDLSGPQCNQSQWTQALALESTPGSWICVGNRPGQGEIHFWDPASGQRLACAIRDVRRVPAP